MPWETHRVWVPAHPPVPSDEQLIKGLDDYRLGQICSVPPADRRNMARAEVNRRARERGEPEPFILEGEYPE